MAAPPPRADGHLPEAAQPGAPNPRRNIFARAKAWLAKGRLETNFESLADLAVVFAAAILWGKHTAHKAAHEATLRERERAHNARPTVKAAASWRAAGRDAKSAVGHVGQAARALAEGFNPPPPQGKVKGGSLSTSHCDEGGGGEGDDPMLLSQARSGEAASAAPAPPTTRPPPRPRPPLARTASSARSVRFAPGPLATTDDGHPPPTEARPKGGPPRGARALARGPWWEQNAEHAQEPLTPAHLRLLAAELGPVNAPSITRLQRRAGFLPPLKRALAYLGHAGSGRADVDAAATVVAGPQGSPTKVGRMV